MRRADCNRYGFNQIDFGRIQFGKVLYQEPGQPPNAARAEVSDHLPLWAEFRVTELEHQLNQILNRER